MLSSASHSFIRPRPYVPARSMSFVPSLPIYSSAPSHPAPDENVHCHHANARTVIDKCADFAAAGRVRLDKVMAVAGVSLACPNLPTHFLYNSWKDGMAALRSSALGRRELTMQPLTPLFGNDSRVKRAPSRFLETKS